MGQYSSMSGFLLPILFVASQAFGANPGQVVCSGGWTIEHNQGISGSSAALVLKQRAGNLYDLSINTKDSTGKTDSVEAAGVTCVFGKDAGVFECSSGSLSSKLTDIVSSRKETSEFVDHTEELILISVASIDSSDAVTPGVAVGFNPSKCDIEN